MRKTFWKSAGLVCLASGILLGAAALAGAACSSDAAAEQLGWKLGTQAYSFNRFSFFEAADRTASLGLKYIEAYPGQRLAPEGDAQVSHSMDAASLAKMQEKLKSAGLQAVCYGVVNGKDEAEWRQILDFAKALGIGTINTEPAPEQLDMIEKLCEEYKIRIGIHNHPSPSPYWDPEIVLEALKGRSPLMGACADTGHWVRSGLEPIECLRKLDGRIMSVHFKDLKEKARDTHDVPWGQGVGNVYGQLAELKRQGYQGAFSIEYEHNWENSLPEILQCVDYFHLMAAALAPQGYEALLKEDLSNATCEEGAWKFDDGVLGVVGKGDIWTKERYGDFVLSLEFKCDKETNSGVFIRTDDIVEWLHTAIEVQILQPTIAENKHNCGGVFDCLGPTKQTIKPAGEWNRYTIIARQNRILVILNGEQVLDMDLDLWTEAHKNPDGTPNKFNTAYKDMAREGYIGLQYHGHPVWFRNLKIKPLKGCSAE